MKEINIGKVIIAKRKEKGITQKELAEYIGVSKASVCKWEIGQSYPDITFLPRLAAYFNISIDDLIGYEKQMTKDEIKKLYYKLCSDFTLKPFDEVIKSCREIVKKYYSCFPLLFYMGALIINNSPLSKDPKKISSLIEEAKALFNRIKTESEDVELANRALYMEAYCFIMLKKPEEVFKLVGKTVKPKMSPELFMSTAYQMTGKNDKAKETLQIIIYQNIVELFSIYPSFLDLYNDDKNHFEKALNQIIDIGEIFKIKKLHPTMLLGVYLSGARGFIAFKNNEKAIDMIQKYVDLITSDIYPIKLKGDDFFDSISNWLSDLDLGTNVPRDEKVIKKSMVDSIINNPMFNVLSDNPRFECIKATLKNNFCEK